MKKLAIYRCGEVAKKCTANGCMRAFNGKQDSFQCYEDEEIQLVAMGVCNGCDQEPLESLNIKIEKFEKAEVDTVHISTCIRGRCERYEMFAQQLVKKFNVIGYTHGSEKGKKDNTINILRNED